MILGVLSRRKPGEFATRPMLLKEVWTQNDHTETTTRNSIIDLIEQTVSQSDLGFVQPSRETGRPNSFPKRPRDIFLVFAGMGDENISARGGRTGGRRRGCKLSQLSLVRCLAQLNVDASANCCDFRTRIVLVSRRVRVHLPGKLEHVRRHQVGHRLDRPEQCVTQPRRSIDGNITMQLAYKPQNVLNRAYGEIAKVPPPNLLLASDPPHAQQGSSRCELRFEFLRLPAHRWLQGLPMIADRCID